MVNANNSPNQPIRDPQERNAWIGGFTPQAEIWNGRLAMLGDTLVILPCGRKLQLLSQHYI